MKKLLLAILCAGIVFAQAQETITCYVENGNDDAYQLYCNTSGQPPTGEMFVDQDGLFMGYTSDPTRYYLTGVRYSSVPVPQGSTIVEAYIQFTSLSANEGQHDVTVCIERDLNPEPFTTEDYNISDRIAWPSYATWSIAEWQHFESGPNQRTYDIKNPLQSMINREEWVKGNPMVFFFDGNYPSHGEIYPKHACAWEYAGDFYAPILTITFTAPASVEELNLAKAMNIFPNPVMDKFCISFTEILKGNYEISISDLKGKKVCTMNTGHLISGDYQFDFSAEDMNLKSGVYLINVKGSKQETSRKIIIR